MVTMTSKPADHIEESERDLYRSVGKRLRQLRRQTDLTQADVAATLGVSQDSVSRYENGARALSIATAIQLAKLYNVSVGFLLDEEHPLDRNESLLLHHYRMLQQEYRKTLLTIAHSLGLMQGEHNTNGKYKLNIEVGERD